VPYIQAQAQHVAARYNDKEMTMTKTTTVFLAPDSILAERLDARDLYDADIFDDISDLLVENIVAGMAAQGFSVKPKRYGDAVWRNQSHNCHIANMAKAWVDSVDQAAFQRALDMACEEAIEAAADRVAYFRNLADAYNEGGVG